jgi:hypothetical protein
MNKRQMMTEQRRWIFQAKEIFLPPKLEKKIIQEIREGWKTVGWCVGSTCLKCQLYNCVLDPLYYTRMKRIYRENVTSERIILYAGTILFICLLTTQIRLKYVIWKMYTAILSIPEVITNGKLLLLTVRVTYNLSLFREDNYKYPSCVYILCSRHR